MNIVVIDSGRLAGEADFPEPDLPKYGWLQYLETPPEEMADHCWRSDVIISVDTPVEGATIDKAFKLKLIAVAGEACGHIDLEAARARGIEVRNVPGAEPADAAGTERICREVMANIDAFLRGEERNRIA